MRALADLLIKNGTVFTYIHEGYHALKFMEADVLIENGVITKIGRGIKSGCEALDASGCLVLPGMINMGGSAIASSLLRGLLQDKDYGRVGGTPAYTRVLPVLRLAASMLNADSLEAVAVLSLWEGLSGGTVTAVDMCEPIFAGPVKNAAEKLGMRLYAAAAFRDRADPELKPGGAYVQGTEIAAEKLCEYDFPAIYSLETASDALASEIAMKKGPRFVYADYSGFEDRPVKRLSDLGFLREDTVLCQCALASDHDIELMGASRCSVAISAAACAHEGKRFPAVDFLRGGVNTALATGYYGSCMISEMRTAAILAKQSEGNAGRYQATDAFYSATVAGARALGRDDFFGRIDAGMSGDLSVASMERFWPLSYPFIQYLYGAGSSDIKHVICGGRVCKRDFKACGDTASAVEKARETAPQAISAVWDEAIRHVL